MTGTSGEGSGRDLAGPRPARGYTFIGHLFIALFAAPLLTVGVWRLLARRT